ncbi:aminoacyl-tRNA hydrolase [Proteocatella sphenisci]|uniref:aminoacyl-tRNA hydrolase n=1 Tax=Proteocatella sphenisci TaxID=181070 RepID=UPI00048FE7D5|nr:aminoacyl-tRNA hydrolase [Proteocatella sphenisci]
MYLIVGLGNPGKQYETTRHNVGFVAVDEIAKELDIKIDKLKFKSLIGEARIGSEKIILAKPQTFMNLSGQAVVELMNYYKVDPSKMIVIYDDIDLDTGRIRIRKSGSSGTHNGMRNIIYILGNQDFPRIRIGVSRPKHGEDLANFVLGRFDKTEADNVVESIKNARKAVIETVETNLDKAMNMYNK